MYQGTANSPAFVGGHASLPKLASNQPTSLDAAILVLKQTVKRVGIGALNQQYKPNASKGDASVFGYTQQFWLWA